MHGIFFRDAMFASVGEYVPPILLMYDIAVVFSILSVGKCVSPILLICDIIVHSESDVDMFACFSQSFYCNGRLAL